MPQECLYLTAHELQSDLLSGSYQVPSYQAWLARSDKTRAYRCAPPHAPAPPVALPRRALGAEGAVPPVDLRELFAVYPDARVVQTHRDPLVVMASMTSLVATLFWLRSDRVDPRAIAKTWLRGVAFMLNHSLEQREQGLLPEDRLHDVLYHELVRDPIGEVRRLYERFEMELTPEAETRMRSLPRDATRRTAAAPTATPSPTPASTSPASARASPPTSSASACRRRSRRSGCLITQRRPTASTGRLPGSSRRWRSGPVAQ